jgi:hypothetical protein
MLMSELLWRSRDAPHDTAAAVAPIAGSRTVRKNFRLRGIPSLAAQPQIRIFDKTTIHRDRSTAIIGRNSRGDQRVPFGTGIDTGGLRVARSQRLDLRLGHSVGSCSSRLISPSATTQKIKSPSTNARGQISILTAIAWRCRRKRQNIAGRPPALGYQPRPRLIRKRCYIRWQIGCAAARRLIGWRCRGYRRPLMHVIIAGGTLALRAVDAPQRSELCFQFGNSLRCARRRDKFNLKPGDRRLLWQPKRHDGRCRHVLGLLQFVEIDGAAQRLITHQVGDCTQLAGTAAFVTFLIRDVITKARFEFGGAFRRFLA